MRVLADLDLEAAIAPLAAVGSAPVAVFTVLLARVFLREAVPPKQWLGIGLVAAAGGALAYLGHG